MLKATGALADVKGLVEDCVRVVGAAIVHVMRAADIVLLHGPRCAQTHHVLLNANRQNGVVTKLSPYSQHSGW